MRRSVLVVVSLVVAGTYASRAAAQSTDVAALTAQVEALLQVVETQAAQMQTQVSQMQMQASQIAVLQATVGVVAAPLSESGSNTSVGENALVSVTTGSANSAVGQQALRLNTTTQDSDSNSKLLQHIYYIVNCWHLDRKNK